MKNPYKKVTRYHFEVLGEIFAITYFNEQTLEVEEVRKNGQEDSHMGEILDRNSKGLFEY